MFAFDLLYPSEEKRQEGRQFDRISERLTEDLQLEALTGEGLLSKEEYDWLCEEIRYLPSDREVIAFRQTVLTDLLNNPRFMDDCMEFCGRLKDNIPRKRYNVWERQAPVYKNLEAYIELLKENYQVLCTVDFRVDKAFQSEVLNRMVCFLEGEEYRECLKEIIELLGKVLTAGAVGYEAEYTYGQVMKSVKIERLFSENTYRRKETGMFRKKAVIDEEYLIKAGENLILRNNMDEIFAKTIVRLCDFASRLNNALVGAFRRIERELSYYRAGIKLYHMYRRLRIPACLPQAKEEGVEFEQLYPVRLLAECFAQGDWSRAGEIQGNDYSDRDGRTVIITGFNSGGKTTFLQAVGSAQILMQLGFHVPAVSYGAAPVSYIGSLFANVEDIRTVHGKLEQELVDIRRMAGQVRKGSLLLINEILATTSEEEGTDIMAEVLHAFSHTHSRIFFVTHLGRLADLAEEGRLVLAEGECAVNYVTEQYQEDDGSVRKTHRIRRGRPEKEIFERELVRHYLQERR